MDVSQLQTLLHVAELGSLSKAAERLHIAQPALSRQIRMLESELGVALFERHGRGMVITPVGRDVLDHATRVLAELEAIRNVATEGHAPFTGTVSIGTTPTVGEIITVPLVKSIRETHPRLEVRFSSAYSGHILEWVQRGEIDLAVSYDPQPMRSLRIRPIMLESLMLVGASIRGGTFDNPVRFSDLANHAMILPSSRHGLRALVNDHARQVGIDLNVMVEADSFNALIDLVRSDLGVTVLPLAPIYPFVKSGDLCVTPIIDPEPTRKLVLAYPADRAVSAAARFVGDTFMAIASDLVKRNIWVGKLLIE